MSNTISLEKKSVSLVSHGHNFQSDQKYNISISHEKEFIWFRVAKVGTNTIMNVLDRDGISTKIHHEFFSYYPVQEYQNYFKFAFIRNPWDRLVSCWHSKVVESNYFRFPEGKYRQMNTFSSFVDYVEDVDVRTCDMHLRLQSRLIDLNNVDYIGRFETFEKDLFAILMCLK
jgi:hypothetical protein